MGDAINKPVRHNRRFIKNTAALFAGTLKEIHKHLGRITVRRVTENAGMRRQSFYRHSKNIEQAIKDGEASLIQDFEDFLDSRVFTGSDAAVNRRVFVSCFLFMTQRREVFCLICCDMALQEMIYRMMVVLYPKLKLTWHPKGVPDPAITSERVDIYFRRMVGVICWWGRTTQCDIDKADPYVWQLIAITDDVTSRNKV